MNQLDTQAERASQLHDGGHRRVPETHVIDVDGRSVASKCLGFRARRDGIEMYLEPESRIGLPERLRLRVLGYGMSAAEAAFAKRLVLPEIRPDHGVAGALDWLDLSLWLTKKLFLGGLLAERVTDAWAVVHTPHDAEFGALVRLDLNQGERGTLLLETMEALPAYKTDDGRIAVRERLEALAIGDRVVVVHTESEDAWPSVEGLVAEAGPEIVSIDVGGQRVAAHRLFTPGEPWLAGRVETPAEARRSNRKALASGDMRTLAVVECKAPGVSLTKEVLDQGLG